MKSFPFGVFSRARRVALEIFAAAAALAILESCVPVPAGQEGSNPASPQGSFAISNSSATAAAKADPIITNTLIKLFDNIDQETVSLNNTQGAPIADILGVGTPIGFQLRNHYLNIGVPLAQALTLDSADPHIRQELVTMARWSRDSEVRAAALIVVANEHNPDDLSIYKEALIHLDPGVRFGAMEALAVWGHPDQAIPLIKQEADTEALPILKVYAASLLAKMGEPSGLDRLRSYLGDSSWVVRAMAARALGDYGTGDDYDRIVSRLGQEQLYDFVVAEDCIAAIKLFPKKNPQ